MSNKRKIDTSLAEMLVAMKMDSGKKIICVVDAESTRLLGGGGIIWDFGYSFGDVQKGETVGKSHGSLVYESIKDQRLIDEISNWNRVKNATLGGLYDFYNILKQDEWWNEDVITPKEIERHIEEFSKKKQEDIENRAKKQLEKLRNIRNVAVRSAKKHRSRDAYKQGKQWTREQYIKRLKEASEAEQKVKSIQKFLETGENVEKLIKQGILSKSPTLNDIKSEIYNKMYWEQKKEYSDKEFFSDSAHFKELKISYNIDRWKNIVADFRKNLDAKGDSLLAISAYNLGGAEQRFLKQTCAAYGNAEDANVLDEYANICAMNFAKLMVNLDVGKVIDGLMKYSGNDIVESVAKSLSKTKLTKEKLTMEMWYKNIFTDKKDYEETHRAMEDSYDTVAAMAKVIKEEIVILLNR